MERETCSHFVASTGKKENSPGVFKHYLRCHRSGTYAEVPTEKRQRQKKQHGSCFFFSTTVGFRANEDVVETAWKAPSGNELPQLYLLGSCGYTPTRSCLHICTPRLYLDSA
uniref:Tick transposon n=1 Tax=Rhipicephalus appendiculatus TaxID=34631 RepID=A0A131YCR4_RHIAP